MCGGEEVVMNNKKEERYIKTMKNLDEAWKHVLRSSGFTNAFNEQAILDAVNEELARLNSFITEETE